MSRIARAAIASIGVKPMPERQPTSQLTFALPPALLLAAQPGRQAPCLHRVRLDVGRDGTVTIGGYDGMTSYATRDVMAQLVRFLDQLTRDARRLPPQAMMAELTRIMGDGDGRPERYCVVLNARVALVRTMLAETPLLL